MPPSGVIPVLNYPDVVEATRWLCAAFGFRERLLIGTHVHSFMPELERLSSQVARRARRRAVPFPS